MQQILKSTPKILATKEHCAYCFDVLIAHLTKKKIPAYPSTLSSAKVPLFVTWQYNKEDMLRGCIGTFEPEDISALLPQYTLTSALEDPRFRPITIEEVKLLNVSVSLLVNFQKRKDAYDWEIGKNGIIITFKDKGQEYDGTFLPEVAEEEKWDKETTLKYLVEKTGYMGNYKSVISKISLESYESSKFKLSYEDYMKEKK